jgi:molybdenum cofactor guanylyltransferase
MHIKEKITGIILAGGKSSRMESEKSSLIFRGKRLIEYPYELMKGTCQKIIISTNTLGLNLPDVTYVPDNFRDTGPLAGMEAALSLSDTTWNFVVPCDMPFVDRELFTAMHQEINGYDCAVLMDSNGKATPLVGFFNRSILPIIIQQIKSGDYKISKLLKKLNVKYYQTTNSMVSVNFNSMNDLKPFLEIQNTKKLFWPNLLLIAGVGKNSGKTNIACEIIKHLAKKEDIIAIKISPHNHMMNAENPLLVNKQGLMIAEEMNRNRKDS